MSTRLQAWRTFLVLVWVVTLLHFLKDITQDILKIATPLDLMGDIQEDVSRLPVGIRWLVYGAGVGSFFAENFLLIAIPKVLRQNGLTRLEWWIKVVLTFMLIYFPVVLLLDPRFWVY